MILLSAFSWLGKNRAMSTLALPMLCLWAASSWAIPPNTPVTNTATVDYAVAGVSYSAADSETLVTDAGAGNSPPYGIQLDPASVAENLSGGVVGVLTVADSDPSDSHTYSVSDSRFEVVANTLQLVAGVSLDFETETLVNLTVTVTDSAAAQFVQGFAVTVTDVNESPTDIALSAQTLVANTAGASVGAVVVTDPDAGDTHTYSVDEPRFEIVNGQLKLIDGTALVLGEQVSVTVTATDAGGLSYVETFVVTAVPPGGGSGVNASLAVLQHAPSTTGAQSFELRASQCDAGAGLSPLAPPTSFAGPVAIPGTVPLLNTNLLKSGDALFVQLLDADANMDAASLERVRVVLQTASGDLEAIEITETAVDSGVFVGYIQTGSGANQLGNCAIEVDAPQTLTVRYTDAADVTDQVELSVLVDPFGVVFDSGSGTPINGATIMLLDAATNAPAVVFADDAVSAYPATLESGDAGFGFARGAYRYPFVPTGDYVLQVTPPNRFNFPSGVSDAQIQTLPGAPYALGPGARGQVFTVPVGPAVRVDIPLDLLPVTPSASSLSLQAALPGAAGSSAYVAQSQCFDGSTFAPAAPPNTLGQGQLAIPGNATLTTADRYARGDVIFVTLVDPDQDLDPFAPDRVVVEVSVAGSSELERLELVESNDSTGVFSGYLQGAVAASGSPFDCALQAPSGSLVQVRYTDAQDASDTALSEVLYDPGFTTFSSADGSLLSGATVTLLDAATGTPAVNAVFSVDGATPFPATVTVGGSVADSGGLTFDFAAGTFNFPVIAPGLYRLDVTPPVSYEFPSQADDSALNGLPAGPFVLTPGSRGTDFEVFAGLPPAFDIPLDPLDAEIFVSKQASKEVAGIGEFVQYQVQVRNGDASGTVSTLELVDSLPLGFRLVADSVQVAGAAATAQIAPDGEGFRLGLANLGPGESVEVRYVTEITAGADLGRARNAATVVGTGVGGANVAFADVQVKEDLLQSKAILAGQVFANGCEAGDEPQTGMADIRIWLEDGTFVVTDSEGKFHIEGIEPGTHVVQLDQASVPPSHEVVLCEDNSRFAGAAHSRFIDVQAGTLWRADFYLAHKPDQTSEIVTRLDAEAADGMVRYTYHMVGGAVPLQNLRTTVMLDDQLAFLSGSAKVNGETVSDPTGIDMGAPTFKLPDSSAGFSYTVEFAAFVKIPRGPIESKAVTLFATDSGRHRTEVNKNELSLNWPASLVLVAESLSADTQPSAGNRALLEKVRASNAERLPADQRPDAANSDSAAEVSIQSEVHEPSRGSNRARSNVSRTQVSVAAPKSNTQPYLLPELDRGQAPPFDLSWLQANKDAHGIAWPPERYNPVLPAVEVAVVHNKGEKPVLMVDGQLVNPVTYEGTTTHHEAGVSLSRWDNVTISERDSVIEARLLDRDGRTVASYQRDVHFSGAPARAELVEAESYLVADGLHPPVVAVRLFDRAGFPLRAGTTGEFSVMPPYMPLDKAKHLESLDNKFNNLRYQVLRDGIAYIQLEPTTSTGEVEVHFDFDVVRKDSVRARLIPGARDWIMVGLLEGTYTHNDLSGNLRALERRDLEDEHSTDGRMAFYAKGMVKGEWLLTLAYDTDKKFERRLREQIDPNRFYTLYGDGTEQRYDAESQRKLYLKLERSQFAGLFGDFDTDFERSELARYDRRMNGVNLSYFGKRVEVSAFASETDQAFVRDEIPGDGTSGVYRLSNGSVVVNSETVRLVTRDRFDTRNELAEENLSRYLDYTIDYDRGTLIFKQPIFSQDGSFNPVFIEVEYEVADEGADEEVVAGTRLAYRLGDADSEAALTYVNDGTEGQSGDLLAADLTWQMNDAQKLTVEFARTDTDLKGSGGAYLLELEHTAESLAGRAYLYEQESAFGLGNQSALEAGTRKFGIEGEYRLGEDVLIRGQSFQQTRLDEGLDRQVVNAIAEWRLDQTQISGGVQAVREDTTGGDSAESTQLKFGVAQNLMDNKVVLRSDAEVDISSGDDVADYPSRAIFGAEYELINDVTLVAEQELTWSDQRDTQDTRFGVRARPWTGGDVNSFVSREQGENGERLFATTGLLQQWRINDRWLYDVGFDRVQTLSESGSPESSEESRFNPNVPAASGSFDGDFSAFFTGVGYRREAWDVSSRLEWHAGDQADKWNFLVGANHQLDDGKVVALSLAVLNEESSAGAVSDSADLRLGLAWRPGGSPWSLLNRTDLVFEAREDDNFDTRTRKWVNNFNLNYKPALDHQVALQFGFKYVLDDIDGSEYDSTTALYGLEYRYDLSRRWDLGLRGGALQSFGADAIKYSYGLSVGYSIRPNTWVSVGFNWDGFTDDDFIAADYTAKGPYLKVRMKFDQALAKRFLAFAGLEHKSDRRSYANGR